MEVALPAREQVFNCLLKVKYMGIVPKYSSPDDKRTNAHAETSVRIIEMGTKAIMMEKGLPIEWWQEAADQAAELRNLHPSSRNMISSL